MNNVNFAQQDSDLNPSFIILVYIYISAVPACSATTPGVCQFELVTRAIVKQIYTSLAIYIF